MFRQFYTVQFYTVSRIELEGLLRCAYMRKPELQDMEVVGEMAGWSTVYVPKWDKSIREFYGLLNGVSAPFRGLGRFAPVEVVKGSAVAVK